MCLRQISIITINSIIVNKPGFPFVGRLVPVLVLQLVLFRSMYSPPVVFWEGMSFTRMTHTGASYLRNDPCVVLCIVLNTVVYVFYTLFYTYPLSTIIHWRLVVFLYVFPVK
jgi:uncharacterized membrane protein (DUF441 family)